MGNNSHIFPRSKDIHALKKPASPDSLKLLAFFVMKPILENVSNRTGLVFSGPVFLLRKDVMYFDIGV